MPRVRSMFQLRADTDERELRSRSREARRGSALCCHWARAERALADQLSRVIQPLLPRSLSPLESSVSWRDWGNGTVREITQSDRAHERRGDAHRLGRRRDYAARAPTRGEISRRAQWRIPRARDARAEGRATRNSRRRRSYPLASA